MYCAAAMPSSKGGHGGKMTNVRLDRWTNKGQQGEVFTLCVRGRDNFEFLCKIRDTLELATLLPADKVALYRQQQHPGNGAPRTSDGDDDTADDEEDDDSDATMPPTPQSHCFERSMSQVQGGSRVKAGAVGPAAVIKQEHGAVYASLGVYGGAVGHMGTF